MKYLLLVSLLAWLPALAQDSAQYSSCNEKAKVQAELNACANDEAARVEAELNRVYQKLPRKLQRQPEATTKCFAESNCLAPAGTTRFGTKDLLAHSLFLGASRRNVSFSRQVPREQPSVVG